MTLPLNKSSVRLASWLDDHLEWFHFRTKWEGLFNSYWMGRILLDVKTVDETRDRNKEVSFSHVIANTQPPT